MSESNNRKKGLGLSGLIEDVQLALPEWLTLTISNIDGSEKSEPFHIQLNSLFVPLDYENPVEKINDLIDHLHSYVRYEQGSTIFNEPKAFTVKDYVELDPFVLYEILSNLADIPAAIFITKRVWYADVLDSGFFYPLRNVSAAEFLDHIKDVVYDNID